MRGSLRIGRIAGIDIYIHWSFWLLILWILLIYLLAGQGIVLALRGVVLILAVFGCVVLHELGHALTARRFGIPTRDITLLPIGGLARLQRMPEDPNQEFWIAIAGPAVNVGIALLLYAFFKLAYGEIPVEDMFRMQGNLLAQLLWINIFLAAFNLLPAFPMDGGRILRALLARRMDYVRATQVAASIGQGMAILFAFIGLFFNPFLLLIALFVFVGAQEEAHAALMRTVVRGVPVSHAMITRFVVLHPEEPIERAVEELLSGYEQEFPVVENGRVVGVLTRKSLMKALAERGLSARVADAMVTECPTVEAHAMLEEAFELMQRSGCPVLPVTQRGELVGLLTLENVGEFLMINAALKQGVRRSAVDSVFAG